MRFYSLEFLLHNAWHIIRRFPWVMGVSFAGTVLAIMAMETSKGSSTTPDWVVRGLMAAVLGIPFLFATSMALERMEIAPLRRIPVFLGAVALLLGYTYSMGIQSNWINWQRFWLFMLAAHLFVAVAPWLRGGYTRGFWEYNHGLFMRILVSGTLSAILFAGLAGALAAVQHLFALKSISENAYFWIWASVAGIFNTGYFLAGTPKTMEELEGDRPYPAPAKVLAQYILTPVTSLYLLILYAYAAKTLIGKQWPLGWVSAPILVCALVGILAMLLIHPIRDRDGNKWVKSFSRAFFLALFPLLVLLFLAVWKRISDYGITESRYFGLATGVWIGGIALYFTMSGKRNIKVIPVSLGIMALVISCGPWGAFQVSEGSQIARLRDLLENQGLLRNGKIGPAHKAIGKRTEANIGSVVDYLADRKVLKKVKAWVPDSALAKQSDLLENRDAFLKTMGLKYIYGYYGGILDTTEHRQFSIAKDPVRVRPEFDFFLDDFSSYYMDVKRDTLSPPPDLCEVEYHPKIGDLRLECDQKHVLTVGIKPWLDTLSRIYPLEANWNIPAESLYLQREANGYELGIQFRDVSFSQAESTNIQIEAILFLRLSKNHLNPNSKP
jgi:Domain of unknown function (DUF4153)